MGRGASGRTPNLDYWLAGWWGAAARARSVNSMDAEYTTACCFSILHAERDALLITPPPLTTFASRARGPDTNSVKTRHTRHLLTPPPPPRSLHARRKCNTHHHHHAPCNLLRAPRFCLPVPVGSPLSTHQRYLSTCCEDHSLMLGEFESESIDLHVVVVWSGGWSIGAHGQGDRSSAVRRVCYSHPLLAARCMAPTQIGERVTGGAGGRGLTTIMTGLARLASSLWRSAAC